MSVCMLTPFKGQTCTMEVTKICREDFIDYSFVFASGVRDHFMKVTGLSVCIRSC